MKLLNRPVAIQNIFLRNKVTADSVLRAAAAVRAIVDTNNVHTLRMGRHGAKGSRRREEEKQPTEGFSLNRIQKRTEYSAMSTCSSRKRMPALHRQIISHRH
jgi:hypothetical protein